MGNKQCFKTNADRIRAMSDEELADELTCMSAYPEKVGVMMGNGAFERTYDAMLWWLKQEVRE